MDRPIAYFQLIEAATREVSRGEGRRYNADAGAADAADAADAFKTRPQNAKNSIHPVSAI